MNNSSIVLAATVASISAGAVLYSPATTATEIVKASSKKQAETVTKYRKSLLQLVRSNMSPLGAMAKGKIPMDADVIALNASRIEFLANMMQDYFATDTTNHSVDTNADDDIWDEYDDFTSKANDLVSAAAKLQELVANKQTKDFRKGIGAIGASCKACHDDYKED